MLLASRRRGRSPRSAALIRWLWLVSGSLAIAALGTAIAARIYYPRLLYPAPQDDAQAPAEGTLLTLTARDGAVVHATELAGPKDAPVVVYFHGNGVAMGDELWMARELVRRGLGVVLVEYRGYGLSARKRNPPPSEDGLYEDAEAVLGALAARGIGPDRIALFGESLGTGVAVEMAARRHASSVVLVTPYTSIPEVASRLAFGLPVRSLMRERFDSLAKAAQVHVPVLIVHGTNDAVVPYEMGERLAATLPRARLITVQGGDHNDLFLAQGARLFDAVADFVRGPPNSPGR